MKYRTENELRNVLRSFEDTTIERGSWGHAEHLIVACFYSLPRDLDAAYTKMKKGIFKLLDALEIDPSEASPYHETMTVFWICRVFQFVSANRKNDIVETCGLLISKFDKDYPLRFYSKDRLFSDDARNRFVEPDLQEASFLVKLPEPRE